jgi:hypothetical protein
MRIVIGLLACLCVCESSLTLATDPTPAAVPAAESAPAPVAATSAAAPHATQAATPAAASASASTTRYKPTVQNGQTYYCKSEQVMGSRFEHKVCRTAEQVSADRNLGRDETEKSQVRTFNAPGKP